MQYTEANWTRRQVDSLMEVSATLADMAMSLENCERIPSYLSQTLDLESLTLAVVRDVATEGAPTLLLRSTCGKVSTEESSLFNQQVLTIYNQNKPLSPTDGPTLRHTSSDVEAPSELSLQPLGTFARATVFARKVDEQHRMLLIVHQGAEDPHCGGAAVDMLQLVTDHLAKLLSCVLFWYRSPRQMAAPFDRLTEREWVVLRGLNSSEGEKQLADQLKLSPHTLHSHIKAIYRKVGVQGRLPLLAKVQDAIRILRVERLNTTERKAVKAMKVDSAVAMG